MCNKHPTPTPAEPATLLTRQIPTDIVPIFFAAIDGELIRKNAIRTSGSAGVSQQEDNLWHKMVSCHKESSVALANSIAAVARRLSTEYVDTSALEALLANRGVAIDKCPGLRPVGVGEMVRRIIGKSVMAVTG